MIALTWLICIGILSAAVLGVGTQEDGNQDDGDHAENDQALDAQQEEIGLEDVSTQYVDISGVLLDEEFIDASSTLEGTDNADELNGIAGNNEEIRNLILAAGGGDQIVLGNGDVVIGGEGDDSYVISAGNRATVLDYSPEEQIWILYEGQNAVLETEVYDRGTTIFLNGRPVLDLEGAYDLDLNNVDVSNVS